MAVRDLGVEGLVAQSDSLLATPKCIDIFQSTQSYIAQFFLF